VRVEPGVYMTICNYTIVMLKLLFITFKICEVLRIIFIKVYSL